jgi:Lanthionine synthetase C-like protein
MTAITAGALFDPGSHEPLARTEWDAERARAAIRAIVVDTEAAFTDDGLWPVHPLDEDPNDAPILNTLYLGAAGVIWALQALQAADATELGRDWAAVALSLPERYREHPDIPGDGVIPSFLAGEAGILLVAHTLAPRPWQEEQLLAAVRANVANPSLEILWGSPGTMLAAQVLHERSGDPVWAQAWNESADHLWAAWDEELWCQEILGRRSHVLGPAHGFAGNVFVLTRGDLLDGTRREELERRALAVVANHAQRANGFAQWAPAVEPPRSEQPIRTQWCHGAPGIVTSLSTLAPEDPALTDLFVAGGELTWTAGPLRKGANLCHGTAGNGYAFLKLLERTGDERWLERARAFAMHAVEQVERATAEHGRGRHSLFTGDPGTALYLQSCLEASPDFPTLDYF